jgi:hypothetical protein
MLLYETKYYLKLCYFKKRDTSKSRFFLFCYI